MMNEMGKEIATFLWNIHSEALHRAVVHHTFPPRPDLFLWSP
jgi:hypothetical protein